MNDLISVIVPVYKVEKYLKKCVDSIINQTYKNLEIILVDDGSPDGCPKICDEYATKDSRIKVIHQKNAGLSAARNSGLDIMTGKYVTFVDSDDWIEPSMIEVLINNLVNWNSEISVVCVSNDLEYEKGVKTIKTTKYEKESFAESNIDAMRRYLKGSWAVWDKLFVSAIFSDIRFPAGMLSEDEAIVLHLYNKCKSVCYSNSIGYHYVKRNNNISITSDPSLKEKIDWQKICKSNYQFILEKYPELSSLALKKYWVSTAFLLNCITSNRKAFVSIIPKIKTDLKDIMNTPGWKKHISKKDIVRSYLLAYFYKPYCILVHNIFQKSYY